jgi:hypothetical protein
MMAMWDQVFQNVTAVLISSQHLGHVAPQSAGLLEPYIRVSTMLGWFFPPKVIRKTGARREQIVYALRQVEGGQKVSEVSGDGSMATSVLPLEADWDCKSYENFGTCGRRTAS